MKTRDGLDVMRILVIRFCSIRNLYYSKIVSHRKLLRILNSGVPCAFKATEPHQLRYFEPKVKLAQVSKDFLWR